MKKIHFSKPFFDKKESLGLQKVIKTGWITSGKLTHRFEEKIKKKIKCKYAIAVNSCTNGIYASIVGLNLKEGDEVITSPFTYISTINTLYQLKLKIKLCDINLEDYSLDLSKIKKLISKKTKLIILTHYGGVPVNTMALKKICVDNNISLIQDAATTLGAKVKGNFVGAEKNIISVFSLYANKIITSAEGGIITTSNKFLYNKIKKLIYCGIDKNPWSRSKIKNKNWIYDVDVPGYKFNYTDLQASIGIVQFSKLEKIINYRNKIKRRYIKNLQNLIDKNLIEIIKEKKGIRSSNYLFTILLKKKNQKLNRDNLFNFLTQNKIQPSIHYIPANKHSFYKKKFLNFDLKNSNFVFNNIISLPFHNYLSFRDIDLVSNKVKEFFNIR